MTENDIRAFKEQAIDRDIRSVTNQLNHAFNQGMELGLKIAHDKKPCTDCISRRDVLDVLDQWDWQDLYLPIHFKELIIDECPSVSPQRKVGRWIHHPDWLGGGECSYECSECGMGSEVDYAYCMRCGAKMEVGNDQQGEI